MSGRYYNQFEPWWPNRSVIIPTDRREWAESYCRYMERKGCIISRLDATRLSVDCEQEAIKAADTAIAHAIRESHRN